MITYRSAFRRTTLYRRDMVLIRSRRSPRQGIREKAERVRRRDVEMRNNKTMNILSRRRAYATALDNGFCDSSALQCYWSNNNNNNNIVTSRRASKLFTRQRVSFSLFFSHSPYLCLRVCVFYRVFCHFYYFQCAYKILTTHAMIIMPINRRAGDRPWFIVPCIQYSIIITRPRGNVYVYSTADRTLHIMKRCTVWISIIRLQSDSNGDNW